MPLNERDTQRLLGKKTYSNIVNSIKDDGRPADPTYGTIQGGKFSNILQEQATNAGPSAYASRLLEQNRLGQNQSMSNIAAAMAGERANVQNMMAMRGGLSSGANTNIASNLANQAMLQRQNQRNIGEQQRLGILAQDEAQKSGLLGNLANVEIQDKLGLNDFNMRRYESQMKEWAAAQEASAQRNIARNSGGLFGSGGVLGTGFHF